MIELKSIKKIYQMGTVEVSALKGIDLTVEKGEMVALVGASGSGKSTLMNIMGFLDQPTSGTYFLEGVDVSQLTDNNLAEMRNKKIGFVFQNYNLLPRTIAVANVELPLIYGGAGQKRKRALEALERVGLKDRATHKPSELSGGEQQRVAIARALVNNPSLILADEPTGNLDTKAANEIIAIFCQLNREGITIVMVTHEMNIAGQLKRIVRLLDGQIVEDRLTGTKTCDETEQPGSKQ
jgi:putative ABC transport system ATP-binding protein